MKEQSTNYQRPILFSLLILSYFFLAGCCDKKPPPPPKPRTQAPVNELTETKNPPAAAPAIQEPSQQTPTGGTGGNTDTTSEGATTDAPEATGSATGSEEVPDVPDNAGGFTPADRTEPSPDEGEGEGEEGEGESPDGGDHGGEGGHGDGGHHPE